MPTYLNTATHPIDLGTGAFAAPQQQATIDRNDTITEHVDAGRLIELSPPKPRTTRMSSEESS